ncbi:glycosyltransferase [Rubritalea sp.]|uniref:glycosyltransferase n=1 Tax=Rubritalea sp. TaxID=2109375 RepID=UPI003F4AD816
MLPSHRASVRKTISKSTRLPTDKKLCIFDFESIHIDNVGGRYLHHIITEFEALGYHICYAKHFRFLATFTEKTYKTLLLEHEFSIIDSAISYPNASIVVTDRTIQPANPTQKIITVIYDERIPSPSEAEAFSLPFFVHPRVHDKRLISKLARVNLFENERPIQILFAGNIKHPTYDHPLLNEKYQILSRHQCIDTIRTSLPTEQFYQPDSFEQLYKAPFSPSFTLSSYPTCKIPQYLWLKVMSSAQFFLAAPGVHMPFCHNLIEALACGTIPILQYSQYLTPHLEHKKNCLIFEDASSLEDMVNYALQASPEEILTLRQGALEYYEEFLSPGRFSSKMLKDSNPTVKLYVNAYRVPHPKA